MTEADKQQGPAASVPDPASGFTPERDRRMIMLSCVMLLVVSMFVFALVRGRLVELRDVSGAYAQVAMTDKDEIREQAVEVAAAELMASPEEHLAQWLESLGTVVLIHDKKGRPIDMENINPAMGCVYWLDCGLPVTEVRPRGPVRVEGESVRFWGQIAQTDVAKLELTEETALRLGELFGLQPDQRIPIFFASELTYDSDLPFEEDIDHIREFRGR
jgi:hypothetical protein